MAVAKAEGGVVASASSEAPAAIQPIDREQASPWLGRIFLLHVSKIIEVAARKKRLSIDDCWRHGEKPHEALRAFDAAYEEEQQKPKPSLKGVFWKLSRADFLRSGLCFGTAQALNLASPLFLNRIVRIVEVSAKYGRGDECRDLADEIDRPLCDTSGLVIVPVLFTLVMFLQSVLNAQAQLLSLRLALRFQKMTIAAIFRKSIKLSSIGAGSASSGGIGNLVSNDAQQIMQAAPMMHWLWMAPLFVAVSFMLLGLSVGPSLFVGFAVMLVCMPIIVICLVKAFNQRKFMVKATDERVKLISDVLTGIRVIKAYGWEKAIMDKVAACRKEELRCNTKRGLWMSVLICFMFLVPVFNAIGILSVFAATGNEFTASRVFMALATLNNMRFPIILGPFLIFQFQNFSLAMTRMGAFLALDELPPAVLDRPCAPAFAGGSVAPAPSASGLLDASPAFADGVNAAWAVPDPPADGKGKGKGKRGCPCLGKRRGKGSPRQAQEAGDPREGPPAAEPKGDGADHQGKNIVMVQKGGANVKLTQVLMDINFQAAPGRLTGVFGQVGSGKSSLLQCLLGETEPLGGNAGIRGTVAYAAQQAMIFNATVRQNITLAQDFVIPPHMQETYDEVVRACQLQDDLDLFPAGDLTEIGERGVNLSGGQKQRISLARAAYSGAEVLAATAVASSPGENAPRETSGIGTGAFPGRPSADPTADGDRQGKTHGSPARRHTVTGRSATRSRPLAAKRKHVRRAANGAAYLTADDLATLAFSFGDVLDVSQAGHAGRDSVKSERGSDDGRDDGQGDARGKCERKAPPFHRGQAEKRPRLFLRRFADTWDEEARCRPRRTRERGRE
ncbi:unnamed protein product [Prorocentrum cordatum]|uniref:Uncharacterized protein n=1 Tax=Prorocentrum cordatum TaxID=2364126 RepID=A0ABN9T6K2_9DINO|nr:unnamed protein product [Polarella glacialis]